MAKLSRDQKRKAKLKARRGGNAPTQTPRVLSLTELHMLLSQGQGRFLAQYEVLPQIMAGSWFSIARDGELIEGHTSPPSLTSFDTQGEAVDFAMNWSKQHPGMNVRVIDTQWQKATPYRRSEIVLRPIRARRNMPTIMESTQPAIA